MQKIVINRCYGAFDLSDAAWERMKELGYIEGQFEIERDDPILIRVVEEMGAAANGQNAQLKIVEIPDSVQWQIEGYDGLEHIAEQHRTWQ